MPEPRAAADPAVPAPTAVPAAAPTAVPAVAPTVLPAVAPAQVLPSPSAPAVAPSPAPLPPPPTGEAGTPRQVPSPRLIAGLADARVLVWLLALALLTGVPLMLWFDADAAAHAARLPALGPPLRALHAAASTLLVLGTVLHLVLRLRGRGATWKGVRTGGLAMLSVAVAAITGAFVAQDGNADRLLALAGLAGHGRAAVLVLAIVHVAYASILVLLTTYLHVARWGWARLFGRRLHAATAILGSGALALLLGSALPGSGARWQGATWLVVPALPGLWAWSGLLALVVYVFSRRLARGRRRTGDGG